MANRWDKEFAFNVAIAEKFLLGRGQVMSMFVFYAGEEVLIFPAPFADEGEKQTAIRLARVVATAHDAAAVCFLSEAYIREVKPTEGESHIEAARRVARTERQTGREVVTVMLSWRDGSEIRMRQSSKAIERDQKGKVTGLGPELMENSEPIMGDLLEILPAQAPSLIARAHAKDLLKALKVELLLRGPDGKLRRV